MTDDLSIWEGHGLPTYEAWSDFVNALDMTTPEQEAWLGACKGEARLHERMAKYDYDPERKDWHLAVTRYFWRRVEVLNEYIKRFSAEMDADIKRQS